MVFNVYLIKQTTLKTNGFIQTATAKEKKIVCHGCLLLVKLALKYVICQT
jgi:hypothetical protein